MPGTAATILILAFTLYQQTASEKVEEGAGVMDSASGQIGKRYVSFAVCLMCSTLSVRPSTKESTQFAARKLLMVLAVVYSYKMQIFVEFFSFLLLHLLPYARNNEGR